MIAPPQVAFLVLLSGFLLAGCGRAASTPQPVDTLRALSGTPASPQPSATQMLLTVTPTLPMTPTPTAPTLPPAFTPPPSAIPTTSGHTPTPNPPQAGLWHGGGEKLLLDFFVRLMDGQAYIFDVGILWEGRDECELNARYDVLLPLDENGFTMTYSQSDITFELHGTVVSPVVIEGLLDLRYRGCGNHQIKWRAVPKSGLVQRP